LLHFSPSTQPIFILGVKQRSGTNFLLDLIQLHPDCEAPELGEDFLTHHADLLVRYAATVSRAWAKWVKDEKMEELLCQCLGDGLISFLALRTGQKRIITKTPSVRNVEHFFKFFPRAYLLLLVRDGRSVVESTVKSFDLNFEMIVRTWAEAAETALRFLEANKSSDLKLLLVKYEDLCDNTLEELHKIFDFVGLDSEKYDFNRAINLPVRGSSEFGRKDGEKIKWEPVEKNQDFNPLLRWSHWDRSSHERFNWIAGKYLRQFGYCEKKYETNTYVWVVQNIILDMKWQVVVLIKAILHALKDFLRKILGAEKASKIRRVLSMRPAFARNR
jgi:hypothetical protein